MRLDGYVSLDATVREGWIETKPVFSTGDHLFINGRCDADGYIKVEVMDTWNNVWDEYSGEACETFTGDAVRHQVKWSGHQTVSEVPGAVKLRFYLRNASCTVFSSLEATIQRRDMSTVRSGVTLRGNWPTALHLRKFLSPETLELVLALVSRPQIDNVRQGLLLVVPHQIYRERSCTYVPTDRESRRMCGR